MLRSYSPDMRPLPLSGIVRLASVVKRPPDAEGVAQVPLGGERVARELAGAAVGARAEQNDVVMPEPEADAVELQERDAGLAVRDDLLRWDAAPGQGGHPVRQLRAQRALFLHHGKAVRLDGICLPGALGLFPTRGGLSPIQCCQCHVYRDLRSSFVRSTRCPSPR